MLGYEDMKEALNKPEIQDGIFAVHPAVWQPLGWQQLQQAMQQTIPSFMKKPKQVQLQDRLAEVHILQQPDVPQEAADLASRALQIPSAPK